MSFYTANGDLFEGFSEVSNTEENLNLNKNIHSHLKLSNSTENLLVYPVYPKSLKKQGIFLIAKERNVKESVLSIEGNGKITNYKDSNDKVRNLNLFQQFRLNNDELEILVESTFKKAILENGVLKQGNGMLTVHRFLFSKKGSEARIYDIKNKNKINNVYYKINKKRDMFYLATNSEKTRFLKIVGNKNVEVSKNEASKFSLHQIDKSYELPVMIPKETSNNQEEVQKAKGELSILQVSQKYNLVINENNNCKALKINKEGLLVIDNNYISSENCTVTPKEDNKEPYRLLIAIRR